MDIREEYLLPLAMQHPVDYSTSMSERIITDIDEILKNIYNDTIKHRKISLVEKHHYIPITKI
jgi:hypothetical protein